MSVAISVSIVSNSQNYHALSGLRDQNGIPVLPTAVLVKVSATDAFGAVVLPALTMPSTGANPDGTYAWGANSLATAWVPGNGPWTLHTVVTDPTGLTIYHDFAQIGQETT